MIRFLGHSCLLTLVTILVSNANLRGEDAPGTKPAKPRFTASPKTTFVTGPLRPDGSVDFAAAINARMSEGVTPANNACVLLYQGLGPAPDGRKMPLAFFKELQVPPPEDEGKYLQALNRADNPKGRLAAINAALNAAISRPWKRKEFPDTADWLDENEEPLRKVSAATRCEMYYSPLIVDYDEKPGPVPLIAVLLPGVQVSRYAARLLCVRAMLHLGEGNAEAAWNDLFACHRLGRLVAMGPTVIEGLVGYAIEGMSIDAELTFIRVSRPSAEQARQYRLALNSMPPIARMSEKFNLAERCMCLESLCIMAGNRKDAVELLGVDDGLAAVGKIVRNLRFASADWDVALSTGNSWYDRMVAAMELPAYSDRTEALQKLTDELKVLGTQLMELDALFDEIGLDTRTVARTIGGVVVSKLMGGVGTRVAEDRVRQRFRNLEIAVGLAAFHADHARYPEQLAELRPKYFARRLEDLFSGQAPIYHRQDAGYLLYSVGQNAQDDNGRTFGDTPAGDDLPVRVTETQ